LPIEKRTGFSITKLPNYEITQLAGWATELLVDTPIHPWPGKDLKSCLRQGVVQQRLTK
jgi:hypothetical protein